MLQSDTADYRTIFACQTHKTLNHLHLLQSHCIFAYKRSDLPSHQFCILQSQSPRQPALPFLPHRECSGSHTRIHRSLPPVQMLLSRHFPPDFEIRKVLTAETLHFHGMPPPVPQFLFSPVSLSPPPALHIVQIPLYLHMVRFQILQNGNICCRRQLYLTGLYLRQPRFANVFSFS